MGITKVDRAQGLFSAWLGRYWQRSVTADVSHWFRPWSQRSPTLVVVEFSRC